MRPETDALENYLLVITAPYLGQLFFAILVKFPDPSSTSPFLGYKKTPQASVRGSLVSFSMMEPETLARINKPAMLIVLLLKNKRIAISQ